MTLVPARPSSLHQTPDGRAAHLHAVEALLTERLADLGTQWRRGTATSDTVLGEDDVPELLTTLVMSGGKRLRPQMCWWGWVASGGQDDSPELVRLSTALELLHAFGLAQDDVMDESAVRRGVPTVHVQAGRRHHGVGATGDGRRYGESIAVLAGDLAHVEAGALVSGLPAPVRTLWWQMSVELVRGQARDLSAAALTSPDDPIGQALEVAHAKSGAYTIQRPLQLGATLGGADQDVVTALSRYGRLLGEAFALRDDLLGVWGDPDVTGKPSSDDLTAGKATVLLALAEQRCTGPARAAVDRMRAGSHDGNDVEIVRKAMESAGVRDLVEQRITRAVTDAHAVLRTAPLLPAAVEGLEAVSERIAWRRL
ncbi:polyprenyl synthetase family protein [Kineosporia sp. NBRC 101731]|uniref:polyprenyl synthetase family protein n=1 Tax=Kineosporia sp. NBRC 101731 TaxID=3032199 RepID=UPI0024A20DFD|nr:polyprenyl synthetase family protein [Kineosporia sp. NBRC 101731]GLY31001.1 geranylgeranyl pyrophosphate synthase [Kineosporia sp. NBRC 101731]